MVAGALLGAELAGLLRTAALRLHRGLKACQIDGEAALARDVARQVHGEAVGVIELEYRVAIDRLRAAQCADGALEQHHAVGERLGKALLLAAQHALGVRPAARELGVRLAHLGLEHRHQFVEEGLLDAELVAVAHGTADDPAQHVAAALVRGGDAVDDQKGAGADVIGDHAQGARGEHRGPRELARRADQVLEQVDVVIGMHALHDRRDALEPHAGVHRGARQRPHAAVRGALVLHEDQIPDLDVAVAVLVRRARRAAGHLRSMVVEDLAARSAGTGVAHRPEVRFRTQAREAQRADADVVEPDVGGLVVVVVDRAPQALRIQAEREDEEVPGEMDRFALEVIAEGEVAEHLEEGVVARGVAHVLQIVVLAPGAHAALAGSGTQVIALLLAEEHVLELHHAGVGEQQRRIVAGHERARGHDDVTLGAKEFQERGAHVRRAHIRRFAQGPSVQSGSAPVAARI